MDRICIPELQGRVSPVLDVAKAVVVVDVAETTESRRVEIGSGDAHPLLKAKSLLELKPSVVICGAVSQELEAVLVSAGVELFPNTCGAVDEVLQAYFSGALQQGRFLMPGCCGQRRQARSGWGRGQGRGLGQGLGQGLGRCGMGRGQGLGQGRGQGRGQGHGRGRGAAGNKRGS